MERSILEGTVEISLFNIRNLTPCANWETIRMEAEKSPHSKGAYWQEHLHFKKGTDAPWHLTEL